MFIMDKEIVDKILSTGLLKNECIRLIRLVDLIGANRKTPWVKVNDPAVFWGDNTPRITFEAKNSGSKIPLNVFSSYQFSYLDIKLLQDVSSILTGNSFRVENKNYFEAGVSRSSSVPFSRREDPEQVKEEQENLLIDLRHFPTENIKESLKLLEEILPDNSQIMTLRIENGNLTREYKGEKLFCSFEDGAPYSMLTKLAKSKIPIQRSKLGDKSKNWSRTMQEINERAQVKLQLKEKEELIINEKGGYKINRERYHILY